MKKCLEIIISVFVLAIGLSLPVAAQDATYSCGAYGAGDYSTHDCSEASEEVGKDVNTSTSSSGGSLKGGGVTSDGNSSEATSSSDKTETNSGKDLEGDVFSIIFAKLAVSWGWLVLFGGLLIVGVVIIGLVSRRLREH